mmetsp:Transcript_58867/g.170259  ORF Transcript_58867/g.170259 Transcript_58867/m.170259 type:complete len:230 (+) Transcript_58867:422-1111(+)
MVQSHLSDDDLAERRLLRVRHEHDRARPLRPRRPVRADVGQVLPRVVCLRAPLQVSSAQVLVLCQRGVPLESPRLLARVLRCAGDRAGRHDGRRDVHEVPASAADHKGPAVVQGGEVPDRVAFGAALRPGLDHVFALGVASLGAGSHDVRTRVRPGRCRAHHRFSRPSAGTSGGHVAWLRLRAELHANPLPERDRRRGLVRAVRAGAQERMDIRHWLHLLHRLLHLQRV